MQYIFEGINFLVQLFITKPDVAIQLVSTIIVTLTTVLLAWLTYRYVRLTKHMVDEMRLSREPSVYIDFESPDHKIRFIVGNSGQTPAINIKFEVKQDIPWLGTKESKGISSQPIMKSGIAYLTPGRTLKFAAGFLNNHKGEKDNNILHVVISYENETGKKFSKNVIIDMGLYFSGVLFESFQDPALQTAKAVKELERSQRDTPLPRLVESMNTKKCPQCAEKIPSDAKKCSHCGEELEKEKLILPKNIRMKS